MASAEYRSVSESSCLALHYGSANRDGHYFSVCGGDLRTDLCFDVGVYRAAGHPARPAANCVPGRQARVGARHSPDAARIGANRDKEHTGRAVLAGADGERVRIDGH